MRTQAYISDREGERHRAENLLSFALVTNFGAAELQTHAEREARAILARTEPTPTPTLSGRIWPSDGHEGWSWFDGTAACLAEALSAAIPALEAMEQEAQS